MSNKQAKTGDLSEPCVTKYIDYNDLNPHYLPINLINFKEYVEFIESRKVCYA